jgi:hypothetical protein
MIAKVNVKPVEKIYSDATCPAANSFRRKPTKEELAEMTK